MNRAPADISISVFVWNWTLRGASFITFAQVLVSLLTADAAMYVAKRAGGNRAHMVQVG